MKNKEEVIKEAYSSVFNELPPHAQNMAIRNNGYISTYFKSRFDGLGTELETTIEDGSQYFRPKSLQGIENNNGWIRLPVPESKIDYKGDIWVIKNNGDIELIKEDEFIPFGYATHYQPIEKPKKPLY